MILTSHPFWAVVLIVLIVPCSVFFLPQGHLLCEGEGVAAAEGKGLRGVCEVPWQVSEEVWLVSILTPQLSQPSLQVASAQLFARKFLWSLSLGVSLSPSFFILGSLALFISFNSLIFFFSFLPCWPSSQIYKINLMSPLELPRSLHFSMSHCCKSVSCVDAVWSRERVTVGSTPPAIYPGVRVSHISCSHISDILSPIATDSRT